MVEVKQRWCPECDDYRFTRVKRWESSIAVVYDTECEQCHHIFERKVEEKEKKPSV